MSESAEQRRYPRRQLDVSMYSQVTREESEVFPGWITVLGAGGAFLEVKRPLDVGNFIGLRFVLPEVEEEIVCGGIVRNHAHEHGFGVEFTQLTSSDRELVTVVVMRSMLKETEAAKGEIASPDTTGLLSEP